MALKRDLKIGDVVRIHYATDSWGSRSAVPRHRLRCNGWYGRVATLERSTVGVKFFAEQRNSEHFIKPIDPEEIVELGYGAAVKTSMERYNEAMSSVLERRRRIKELEALSYDELRAKLHTIDSEIHELTLRSMADGKEHREALAKIDEEFKAARKPLNAEHDIVRAALRSKERQS